MPTLPRHTPRTAVRRQTHRRKVVNRGEGPGKLTPPEPLGAGGAFTNLPRRYAARPPELEFRLRLRFDPRTAKDRKSTRLNSSHGYISYAVFCLKKKKVKVVRSQVGHIVIQPG